MKIIDCRFEPIFFWGGRVAQYKVHVTTADNIEKPLFSFYTDEKHYDKEDFIGLTLVEATDKVIQEDTKFLQV